jgi:hypothetical protein
MGSTHSVHICIDDPRFENCGVGNSHSGDRIAHKITPSLLLFVIAVQSLASNKIVKLS